MKKHLKLLLIFFLILLIGIILFFYNAFSGNPISKMIAKSSAKQYLNENYEAEKLIIEDVFYNFKDGYYHVKVKSETSIDTHFTLAYSGKTLQFDDYEVNVTSHFNTYQRIDDEYRKMVEAVFNKEDFPLTSNIDYGIIEMLSSVTSEGIDVPKYGLKLIDLELDKKYDVKQLAKEHGHIIYYAEDEEVSFEKMSELLLILKDELDSADIPFFAVDFVLEKPRDRSGAPNSDRTSINTAHFLYSDIYEEGLIERLEEAATMLNE